MPEDRPRVRTVERYEPPYRMNRFPSDFVSKLAREIAVILAVEDTPALEGPRWEEIFARCIDGEWKPTAVGLDDVRLEQCAWSCKTVKNNNPSNASSARLISGRNSPDYSYSVSDIRAAEPAEVGRMILGIWNERVSSVRARYRHLRTVVLLKKPDFMEFAVYEFDTLMYESERYVWTWNRNRNLEGHDRESGEHRFTWQPHGPQFTIIEPVPADRTAFAFRRRPEAEQEHRERVLEAMGFGPDWFEVLPERPS